LGSMSRWQSSTGRRATTLRKQAEYQQVTELQSMQ
jgi:hypothetical protein